MIVDRRKSGKNKSVGNRQKFIKRYKQRIKRSVDEIADTKGITDVLKDRKVKINEDELDEPNFNFNNATGERDIILPGNKNKNIGDRICREEASGEKGNQGSDSGDGFDEFTFTLTKEEFLDLYFSDMELPDFIKESLNGSNKYVLKRAGYTKEGIPPRLDLLKTLKQSMARRIATKSKCEKCDEFGNFTVDIEGYSLASNCLDCEGTGIKKQRYLDDIDLRYKHYTKQPNPIRKAVMILLMDVSASMGEYEKSIAKKFFLLLYLFLHKVYKEVEVVFVSHTHDAKEVSEQEFFYGQETGGTVVSAGLQVVKDIIDKRVDLDNTNVYISQASDGDNWEEDNEKILKLMEDLLNKVQYFAYIQIEEDYRRQWKDEHEVDDLLDTYNSISNKKLQCRHVDSEEDVYPVLRELFEK
jgi:uncharacterized sporulation protein YeaH/YhbH (DUF444 family)